MSTELIARDGISDGSEEGRRKVRAASVFILPLTDRGYRPVSSVSKAATPL